MADMLFYPELSHSNYSETMIMTPINSTYAVTFGLPRRNVSVVCIREGIMQFRGVWVGDSPFKFVTPVFLLQLSMASILTGTCNFLLKPFGQVSFVSQMLVINFYLFMKECIGVGGIYENLTMTCMQSLHI